MSNVNNINKINKYIDKLTGDEVQIKQFSKMNTSKKTIHKSNYDIMLRLTEKCNMSCDICHWNKGNDYKYSDIIKSIDGIMEFIYFEKLNDIKFYLMGGESSLHPQFKELVKYIKTTFKDKNIIIELQTNLTRETYLDVHEYIDEYAITFHKSQLLKLNKQELFEKNLYQIPHNKLLTLDISLELIDENLKEEFYSDILRFMKLPFLNYESIFNFYRYNKNKECTNQHQEFHKSIEKKIIQQSYNIDGKIYSPNELFKRGIATKGIKCSAGKSGIVLNGDGKVFICDTIASNWVIDGVSEYYTHILKDKLFKTKLKIARKVGTICPLDKCTSAFYNDKIR